MISNTKDTLLCNRMTMAHDEAHYIKPMLDLRRWPNIEPTMGHNV